MIITDERSEKELRFKDLENGETFVFNHEINKSYPMQKIGSFDYYDFSAHKLFVLITDGNEPTNPVTRVNVELIIT